MIRAVTVLAVVLTLLAPVASAQTDHLLMPVTAFRNGTTSVGDMQIRTIEEPVRGTVSNPDLRVTATAGGARYHSYSTNLTFVQFASRRGEYIVNNQTTKFIEIPINRSDITMTVYRQGDTVRTLTDAAITDAVCVHGDGVCKTFCDQRAADRDCTCGDGVCNSDLDEEEFCPQDCRSPQDGEEPVEEEPEEQDGDGDDGGIDLAGPLPYLLAGLVGLVLLVLLARQVEIQ